MQTELNVITKGEMAQMIVSKTVSVVMCTYNGAEFIREQLDSIINQTYPIHELIVQDDCSTDETVAIIKEYMEKYSFIKLYINEHNLGFNQNFKSACMKATGDFVAISDQDDVWFPEKLEKQVETIGPYDICFSNHLLLEEGGRVENDSFTHRCIERLLFFNNVSGHTMLCKRDFIQNPSNWIDFFWYDWGLALNASLQNGMVKVEEPLNLWRKHGSEVTMKEITGHSKKSAYHAYLFGWSAYKKLLKNENRRQLYTHIFEHTDSAHFPLVHQFSGLLLKDDFVSIMRLCRLCQKHRHLIYWNAQYGIMGWVRGFFFPFLHADSVAATMYKDRRKM